MNGGGKFSFPALFFLQASCLYGIIGCYDSTISFPKGQRQSGKFEMLHPERNADDGDTQQYAEPQMRKANPYSSQKNPQHIHQYVQTASRTFSAAHLFAERPQGKTRHLHCLHTERNADDCNHHQQTGNHIPTAVSIPPNTSHKTFIRQPIALHFYVLHCKDTILLVLSE